MDCGAGGTTLRFLLAWASVQEGEEHVITGISRLLERPHAVSYTHLRAHETVLDLVCRLLLEKQNNKTHIIT